MNEKVQGFKAVIFQIGNEKYGMTIDQVLSIERFVDTTAIPNSPEHLLGMIHLRGELIPIIDLVRVFHSRETQITNGTRIIIVRIEEQSYGLVVEEAKDVKDISAELIQPAPLTKELDIPYIEGIASIDHELIVLLNIERLLHNLSDANRISEILQQFTKGEAMK